MHEQIIFGMSEEEEGETSGEEEDFYSQIADTDKNSAEIGCELRKRIVSEVDKFTKEWRDQNYSSDSQPNNCGDVMFLLSTRCIMDTAEDGARTTESVFQLGGVRVRSCNDRLIHEPVIWTVYGYPIVLKVVLKSSAESHMHSQLDLDLDSFRAYLTRLILSTSTNYCTADELVVSIKELPKCNISNLWRITRTLAMQLMQNNSKLLEIQLKNIKVLQIISQALRDKSTSRVWSDYLLLPFEDNLNPCRTFLAKNGLKPSSCIKYNGPNNIQYTCQQIEGKAVRVAHLNFSFISPFTGIEGTNQFYLLRVLSFDLECLVPSSTGASQSTPQSSINFDNLGNIILIGLYVADILFHTSAPDKKEAFIVRKKKFLCSAGKCDNGLEGVAALHVFPDSQDSPDYFEYSTEDMDAREVVLLSMFQYFVESLDPDIITGYNITQFDLPYIHFRANLLRKKYKINEDFTYYGRSSQIPLMIRTLSQNRQLRYHDIYCKIAGRTVFDMYLFLCLYSGQTGKGKLTLKEVARRNLPASLQKLEIPELPQADHWKDPALRRRLGFYCMRDAEIPLELMIKRNIPDFAARKVHFPPLLYAMEKSSQIGITIQQLLNKSTAYHHLCSVYYVHCQK